MSREMGKSIDTCHLLVLADDVLSIRWDGCSKSAGTFIEDAGGGILASKTNCNPKALE